MAKQNLFTTLLTEAITAGSASIKVDTGRVQLVDSTLVGEILTIMPLAEIASFTNSEMVKVTSVTGNTLGVTRAQNGTLAKDFDKDSVVVLASTIDDYLIKKDKSIVLTCNTAAADSPKICTSATGDYTPTYGDELIVDFVNGCGKDGFTLAVDGAGELLVKIGTENATTQHLRSSSRIKVPMWFDGSFYQLYGSQRNDATVNSFGYGVTASATSSVLSIGAGRAVINGEFVFVTAKTLASSTTTVPASGTGYIGIKDNNQLSVSTTGFLPGVLPVCVVVKDSSNKWLPNSIINFNQVKSSNIDFSTFKTRWEVVATGDNNLVIPAGYRAYRINIHAVFGATSGKSSPTIRLSGKSSSAGLIIGTRQDGAASSADLQPIATSPTDDVIAYAAPFTTNATRINGVLELGRKDTTTTAMTAQYRGTGNQGPYQVLICSTFDLASSSVLGKLYLTRNGGTVSDVKFVVEALIENG